MPVRALLVIEVQSPAKAAVTVRTAEDPNVAFVLREAIVAVNTVRREKTTAWGMGHIIVS
jgi:hypothetical protein